MRFTKMTTMPRIKKIFFFSSFLVLISFLSCTSSKDLTYLNDIYHNQKFDRLPDSASQHLVIPGDNLFISINSTNSEVNALFNPSDRNRQQSNSNPQQYTSPEGAYLYGFEVNNDGEIVLPILGNIYVVGLSQDEIEKLVQQSADNYIKDAIVKVKLLSFKVTILGEINAPGVYFNYNNSLSILEALAMAGADTDFADIKNVMVVRRMPEGNKSYSIDLSAKDAFLSEAFYLHPNDYVFVQPNKRKVLQLNTQTYAMVWSSLSILLAIYAIAK